MRRIVLWTRRRNLLLAVVLASAACAREEMPPGTGPDFEAPAVVEMFPAPRSAVPGLDEDAYVRFDEPMGDPRSVARLVETSPAGLYEIDAGRSSVRIRPIDGWRPNVVYTFRIPPGLRDLVRNQTREPIEFLFTTGPEFFDTRAGGAVWDREAVRRVRDIAVHVIGGDSIPYAAVTDTGGNFAISGLPHGDYWAFAFRDQNRNRTLERDFEPHDSGHVSLTDSTSIVELEFWLTPPDSTPPVLGSAQATDSLTLRLEFDDLLEPEAPLDAASVRVAGADTGEEWAVSEFVVGDMAPPASPANDVGLDSLGLGEAADSAESRRIPVQSAEGGPAAASEEQEVRAQPQRFVSVRLARSLIAGTYAVSARGFVNLRLLSGGGDTTLVYEPPPVVPEEEAAEDGADGEGDVADPAVDEIGDDDPADEGEGP